VFIRQTDRRTDGETDDTHHLPSLCGAGLDSQILFQPSKKLGGDVVRRIGDVSLSAGSRAGEVRGKAPSPNGV